MNVKIILIVLSIALSNKVQGGFAINDTSLEEDKYWSKVDKLSWEDFQGQPPPNSVTFYGTEGVANTAAEIMITLDVVNGKLDFKVYPLFIRTKSWHKSNSEKVLIHEQLHFDITELVARKIRKELSILRLKNVTDTVLYLNKVNELMAEQDHIDSLYDSETLHGAVDSMQEEWNKKITRELCELEEYEVNYSEYLEE